MTKITDERELQFLNQKIREYYIAEYQKALKQLETTYHTKIKESTENRAQKAAELWGKLQEIADELVAEGQVGYDNWSSAMGRIIKSLKVLNEAIATSNPIGTKLIELGIKFEQMIQQLKVRQPDHFKARTLEEARAKCDELKIKRTGIREAAEQELESMQINSPAPGA